MKNYLLVTEKRRTVSTSLIRNFYTIYMNITSENTDQNNCGIFMNPLLTRTGKIYYCNMSQQATRVIHVGTSRH